MGQGAIRDGAGSALFTLRYSALVFRPSRGEVLDCVVASVSKVGFFADAGPMQVRGRGERERREKPRRSKNSHTHNPSHSTHTTQVFVSNHLIPDDYEFSAAGEPAFVSADEAARVAAGAEVRLRVVGTRMDASEIFCVASMKDDYLGVISAPA